MGERGQIYSFSFIFTNSLFLFPLEFPIALVFFIVLTVNLNPCYSNPLSLRSYIIHFFSTVNPIKLWNWKKTFRIKLYIFVCIYKNTTIILIMFNYVLIANIRHTTDDVILFYSFLGPLFFSHIFIVFILL